MNSVAMAALRYADVISNGFGAGVLADWNAAVCLRALAELNPEHDLVHFWPEAGFSFSLDELKSCGAVGLDDWFSTMNAGLPHKLGSNNQFYCYFSETAGIMNGQKPEPRVTVVQKKATHTNEGPTLDWM